MTTPGGPPLRVLVVVDDDRDFRVLVRLMLGADARFEIEGEAANAEEAVALARATQPTLVILDHFIEGTVMGLQLAPRLKEVAPDMKILLFTTHDLAVEAAREPAIDRYLRKHDLTTLLPTVREMLGLPRT
ncbi:MAG TPA: response regulator [Mycobacteriales bacterium]|nr:response regulator [Mycobacteriales bacterium]